MMFALTPSHFLTPALLFSKYLEPSVNNFLSLLYFLIRTHQLLYVGNICLQNQNLYNYMIKIDLS